MTVKSFGNCPWAEVRQNLFGRVWIKLNFTDIIIQNYSFLLLLASIGYIINQKTNKQTCGRTLNINVSDFKTLIRFYIIQTNLEHCADTFPVSLELLPMP